MSATEKVYQIIEFTEERTKTFLKVYIVPAKWLGWDDKMSSVACKFMGPPYNGEKRKELNRLVASNSDAPTDWKAYPVLLRGHAGSYEEAQSIVEAYLKNDRAYAYTTENDDHAAEKSARESKKLRDQAHGSAQTLNEILYGDGNKKSASRRDGNRNTSSESDEEVADRPKKKKSTQKKTKSRVKNPISTTDENDSEPTKPTKSDDEARDTETDKTGSNRAEDNLAGGTSPVVNGPVAHGKATGSVTGNYTKQFLLLNKAINRLTVEHAEVKEELRQLKNAIMDTLNVRVDAMTIEKFTEKYDIALDFQNFGAFEAFETALSENEDMLADFKRSLKHLVGESMAKTMKNVTRRIFNRALAMKLTAARQTKEKHLVKSTIFYKVLFELVCTDGLKNEHVIIEHMFTQALGQIFNNSKDWDGHRNDRRVRAGNQQANIGPADDNANNNANIDDA